MSRIDEYRKQLFDAQEKAVRIEHEDWTEEQIQHRCAELRNYIINSENINNRFSNKAIQKIWESPPRIKRIY